MTNIHEQLKALLDQQKADYRIIEHEAEGRTEFISQIRGNKVEQAIKSMVLQIRITRKDNRYVLANIPGDCRVDLNAIKEYFKADSVGFAQKEKVEALTNCVIGSIPPFTFNEQLGLIADPRIKENDEVVFNAGSLEKSIFMKTDDYFRIANPQIVSIATK